MGQFVFVGAQGGFLSNLRQRGNLACLKFTYAFAYAESTKNCVQSGSVSFFDKPVGLAYSTPGFFYTWFILHLPKIVLFYTYFFGFFYTYFSIFGQKNGIFVGVEKTRCRKN